MTARVRGPRVSVAASGVALVGTSIVAPASPAAAVPEDRSGPGVIRGQTWYLSETLAPRADTSFAMGGATDWPLIGDGDDDVAVVRGNRWHIDLGLSGGHAERSFQLGRTTDVPVAGDWDGTTDGSSADEPGVVRGNLWLLDAQPGQGRHEIAFRLGRATDRPFTWGRSGSVVHEPRYTVTYSVRATGGVTADLAEFAEIARQTLGHTLGWSMGGEVQFVRVPRGGDFTLWLATPGAVDAASPGCSAQYSCREGDDVYINERRWEDATDTWGSRPLLDYRYYVINHEVGHWLEVGHRNDCAAAGSRAPVMMQQSIRLYGGCRTNIWPLPSEKQEALRDRLS